MTEKSRYKTKQHDELLAYLKEVAGRHITVGEISAYFKAQGRPIGTATIYRHLEKMVNDGIVNKYTIDNNSSACFEYIGKKTHSGEVCFHYKCEVCGKLVHLHCEEFKDLQIHLMEHHKFKLNPMRTVFYGVCSECMNSNDGSR